MGDENFYQIALKEFDSGNADEGLLAKAWVHANGDESQQKVEYVKLRVTQLKTISIKRAAAAAGVTAKTVARSAAPHVQSMVFFIEKSLVSLIIAGVGVALLASTRGEVNPGAIAGSVLAGMLVIYLLSKVIEWVLLKRVLKNHNVMVALSAAASFIFIFLLWYAAKDKPYAVHPEILANFLLASVIVVFARSSFSRYR